jgi:hypothetical protein
MYARPLEGDGISVAHNRSNPSASAESKAAGVGHLGEQRLMGQPPMKPWRHTFD